MAVSFTFLARTALEPDNHPPPSLLLQVIGQIPSNLLLTRINPARWIPFCELAWTLLTRTSHLFLPAPPMLAR